MPDDFDLVADTLSFIFAVRLSDVEAVDLMIRSFSLEEQVALNGALCGILFGAVDELCEVKGNTFEDWFKWLSHALNGL